MAAGTLSGEALENAILVAGFAFYGAMRAVQWKAGIEVVEICSLDRCDPECQQAQADNPGY